MPPTVNAPLVSATGVATAMGVPDWKKVTRRGTAQSAEGGLPRPWSCTWPRKPGTGVAVGLAVEVGVGVTLQFRVRSSPVTAGGTAFTSLSTYGCPGLPGAVQPVALARTR